MMMMMTIAYGTRRKRNSGLKETVRDRSGTAGLREWWKAERVDMWCWSSKRVPMVLLLLLGFASGDGW